MLAAVRDYVGEVCRRFPLLRIRHAIDSFEDRRRSFANTAGVRRQERRAVHRFSGGNPNHKLDFSGIAKNSFYVEDGEIRFPLIETMVSGNFQDLLMNIRGVSRESINFGGGEFPYLVASGVMISRPRAAADVFDSQYLPAKADREEGWTIRFHPAILHSEPYASADLGAASDVTAKSIRSGAVSASSPTPI